MSKEVEEINEVKAVVSKDVSDLLGSYYKKIDKVRNDSDSKKIKIGFSVLLEPTLTGLDVITKMSFSESIKDECESHIDTDHDQMKMEGMDNV